MELLILVKVIRVLEIIRIIVLLKLSIWKVLLRNIKIELDQYISSLQVHYPVYKSDCRKKHFYNQDHNKLRKDLNMDKWTKINGLVQTGQRAAIKLLFKS